MYILMAGIIVFYDIFSVRFNVNKFNSIIVLIGMKIFSGEGEVSELEIIYLLKCKFNKLRQYSRCIFP